ncbi:MAG: CdaR family protein, partial [Anaerolineales bacterium]|nr:CdaR family protein [Anaerolineales bacterium]
MVRAFAEVLRRFLENLSLFGLALVLAVIVWITAANEENPIEERIFPGALAVTFIDLPTNMVITSPKSAEATVSIRAPAQIWATLSSNQLEVSADVSGLSSGRHTVPLLARVLTNEAEVLSVEPSEISVELERIVAGSVPVVLSLRGEPAVGYAAGSPEISTDRATVTGPERLVEQVSEIKLSLDLRGEKENIDREFALLPLNDRGELIDGVVLKPESTTVTVAVRQLGGYRDVAVRAVLLGKPAEGYRITNITTSPPTITVFSDDPAQLAALPGFVETEPLQVSDASQDIDARLTMALEEGVTAASEQSVLVLVSIEAVESSLRIRQDLTMTGLGAGLIAQLSPDSVDVIMSGPLPVLDSMTAENVKVILDLLHLKTGSHDIAPAVVITGPDVIKTDQVLPDTIH